MKYDYSLNFTCGAFPTDFLIKISSGIETLQEQQCETIGDLSFVFYKSDSPLFACKKIKINNVVFFIIGYFNSDINESMTLFDDLQQDAAQIVRELQKIINGRYIGIIYDSNTRSYTFMLDYFGFDKVYWTSFDDKLLISTSFWVLTKVTRTFNSKAIAQHLAIGFVMGIDTIIEGIKVPYPGGLTKVTSNGCIESLEYVHLADTLSDSINVNQMCDSFLSIITDNLSSISRFLDLKDIGTTLTGGGDTRVILNSMLNCNLSPVCYTGSYPLQDIPRSQRICNEYKLQHIIVEYSVDQGMSQKMINNAIKYSNGYSNGWWMELIARESACYSSAVYYGFSGDLLGGTLTTFAPDKYIEDRHIEYLCNQKSYLSSVTPSELAMLCYSSKDEFLSDYSNTYNVGSSDPYMKIFIQERNERNYKRIGSFAEGIKYGSNPLLFFHDINVIKFYLSIPKRYLNNESLHKILSYHKNPFLRNVPDEGKTILPQRMMEELYKVIPKSTMQNAYRIFKNSMVRQKRNHVQGWRIMFQNMCIHDSDKSNVAQLLDWDSFINNSAIADTICEHDYHTLTMRMRELIESVKIIESTN